MKEMGDDVAETEEERGDADEAEGSDEEVFRGLGDLDVGAEIPSADEEARASVSEADTKVLESDQETEVITEGRQAEEGQVINDEEDDSDVEIKAVMRRSARMTRARVEENVVQTERRAKLLVKRAQKHAEMMTDKEVVSEREQGNDGMETDPSEEEETENPLRRSTRQRKQAGNEGMETEKPMKEPTEAALAGSETRTSEIEAILEEYKDEQA